MIFLPPLPTTGSVLTSPARVAELPQCAPLWRVLRALVVEHRLRAPVTGAHLLHKKLHVWETMPSTPATRGLTGQRHNGVPWLLPPVEHFEPVPGYPASAVADLVEEEPTFEAFEGYVLAPGDDSPPALHPGCWAVGQRGAELVDLTHGHSGVPEGWAYIGIPVQLHLVERDAGDAVPTLVAELPLRAMTRNFLARRRIGTVEQLASLTHLDLRRLPGIGAIAEQEIDAVLASLGRHLPAEPTSEPGVPGPSEGAPPP